LAFSQEQIYYYQYMNNIKTLKNKFEFDKLIGCEYLNINIIFIFLI